MACPELSFALPEWLTDFSAGRSGVCRTDRERMALALDLARRNVERGTGGPFGAAVFEVDSGRLFAPGVNLVTAANCSVLHAEMVAIMLAQLRAGTWNLGREGRPALELVTSCEPCAMCYGAVPWSGVRRLICGAREEDARQAGFDEGEKPADWPQALERRGIAVARDVLRKEAAALLRAYAAAGGVIYNPPRRGGL